MSRLRRFSVNKLAGMGTRFLPFADVASEQVPLSRLLRLSLFQVTVGMALVLLIGTLNRVMIVELKVSATLVGFMLALPLLFAPFRMLIGFKSDTHKSALGLRRVPYIIKGTMLQFGGFAVMPFALLVLSGYGEAVDAPLWIGHGSAALAFLLVGAGLHMVQTVGLALATDLVPEEDQPNVVGLMYVMLLLGMIASALIFGALLQNYSPGRLIQVIQGAAVITIVLNGVALWKQEAMDRVRARSTVVHPTFRESVGTLMKGRGTIRLLVIIGLGTAGFGMSDVVLEPFGGQVLGMTVAETTRLTAIMAGGGLFGFSLASYTLNRGASPVRLATLGVLSGVIAFASIIMSTQHLSDVLFMLSILLAGFGGGLFSHGTLTATMRSAPRNQIGLSLGAWGAVQATAAGLSVVIGGIIRDSLYGTGGAGFSPTAFPYVPIFALEVMLLVIALFVAVPLLKVKSLPTREEIYAQ
jgi:BCD family chlorophyll transporter-like MFS transporter